MNIKPGILILPTVVIVVLLMIFFHPVAMASPDGQCDQKRMGHEQLGPEKMHEHIKVRLDKLAERLEIKASQQAAWGEFAKSVEMLAERSVKKPNDDADAATISRYRAEMATEFAKKLTKIADATAKLQKALNEDQRKILNQAAHRFLQNDHGWSHKDHGMNREGNEYWMDRNGRPDVERHPADADEHKKDSW